MYEQRVLSNLILRQLQPDDVNELFSLVSNNRDHLLQWLPEDSVFPSINRVKQFITPLISTWGFQDPILKVGLWYENMLAGLIQCAPATKGTIEVHIGYWLGKSFEGNGLMIRSLPAILDHNFFDLAYQRSVICCAVENKRSRRIPEKLGFDLEYIRPKAEWISNRYVDHAVYAMWDVQWKQNPFAQNKY